MFDNMFGKLHEMKAKMDSLTTALNDKFVEVNNKNFKAKINGNGQIINIELPTEYKEMEKEEIEDYLTLLLNNGLSKANELKESETKALASGFLPGM
jgi:DNA-binding protein YbaB